MTDIGIDLHLMTRGSSKDYRFIGTTQVDRWWSKYSKLARFEAPTVIVEGDKFYLSGITSSSRRDRVGTPIRYVLAGRLHKASSGAESNAIKIVTNLIAKASSDLSSNEPFARIAELFDIIDNESLENALADDEAAQHHVLEEMILQLKALPDAAPRALPVGRKWYSGRTEDGLSALIATAEHILTGNEPDGLAAYLNLAEVNDVQGALSSYQFGGIVVKEGPRRPKALTRPLNRIVVGVSLLVIMAIALALMA